MPHATPPDLGDMAFAAEFSDTIGAIYDAALMPDSWPAALSRVGALCDAAGAAIVFWRQNTQAEFIISPEIAPTVEIYLGEEWWRRDLHALRAIGKHASVGDLLTDFDLATPTEIETHPMYAEFFHRFGWGWVMTYIVLPDVDSLVTVTLPRFREKGPYSERETAVLRLLGRHVEQALRMSLRLGEFEASEVVMRSALDALDADLFALDSGRRLIMANTSGAARFDDFFAIRGGRVVARRADEAPPFEALMAAAEATPSGIAAPRACVLTASDGRRVAVWAMPLTEMTRRRLGGAEQGQVLLLATCLERDHRIDPAVIRDIFKLSLGEARIASLVGAGVTIRRAAETLGITEGTARLVLKHAFGKLGINRQTELALRIAALGWIRP